MTTAAIAPVPNSQLGADATPQDRWRQRIVVLAAVVQSIVAAWYTSTFITDESIDATPVYFLPAGYTFIVWGVIFALSLVYAMYQLRLTQATRTVQRATGWWIAACFWLTALWMIPAGTAGIEATPGFRPLFVAVTVPILFAMLGSLTVAMVRLNNLDAQMTRSDRWLLQAPTAIFFAWLNVAAIANTTAALDAYGVTGGGWGWVWAAALVIVAFALASTVIRFLLSRAAIAAYAGVIVWAFVGLFVYNLDYSLAVAFMSLAAGAAIATIAVLRMRSRSAPPLLAGNRATAGRV